MRRSRGWLLALALSGAALTAAAAVGAWKVLPASGRPAHGLFVGSRVLPADRDLGAWLDARRIETGKRPVTLLNGMQAFDLHLSDLGVEIDVAATMNAALRPGRTGVWKTRAVELMSARRGEIDVPLVWSIDARKAATALSEIAPLVYREPKDARLDLTAHLRIPEITGEELDLEATLDSVARGMAEGHEAYRIVTRPIRARVTTEALAHVDIEHVVGSFETKFQLWGTGAGRAVNIGNAAHFIDGTVLMPGQEFSYNQVVGPRTRARGFTDAPEIVGDELQNGVGGGVCQVASTLYAAALYSALDIEERSPHGRPSSYTRFGLDATVSYPTTDLRFRNTLPYPILLHVFLPKNDAVRAEILGGEPIAKVEYLSGVARTQPFVRRITRKPFLASGKAYRHQKGIKGYSVYSLVRITYNDGRKVERGYSSEYRPTPEVFWVSADYDEAQLPALPEGATGVEGREVASSAEARTSG
ncbi:MAG: VanW family protein [Deltaproteobacteria bacterium]|nr:VanW family protein [Deltaproteobacteria bacterium]